MNILASSFAGIATLLGGIAGAVLIVMGAQVAGWWTLVPFVVIGILVATAKHERAVRVRHVPPTPHALAMAALRRSRPLAIDAVSRSDVRRPRVKSTRYTMPLDEAPTLDPSDSLVITDETEDYDDDWTSLQ